MVMNLADCFFYHTMDIPGYGTVHGNWDIRGNESTYLGDVELNDKRVLEIGPASGQLTFFMERQGAKVVSLEAAEDFAWEFFWDLPDSAPEDLGEKLEAHRAVMEQVRNSFWLCHRAFSSKAEVHYGNAYSVPEQLGMFDVSILACMLLHNKNPLGIIENCARVTQETIIIVEVFQNHPFSHAGMELLQNENRKSWDTWWGFSPGLFVDVLKTMGLPHHRVTFHTQQCRGKPIGLFTVVASRRPFADLPTDQAQIRVKLNCSVERLRIEANELTFLAVSIVNLGETPLSSFSTAPVVLSYHWRQKSGEVAIWDGIRTSLPRTLSKGDKEDLLLVIQAPVEPGAYVLEITMLKESVVWYDYKIPGIPLRIETVVTPYNVSSGEAIRHSKSSTP